MKLPSRRVTLLAGLALILLTNAVALGGVWWNRSGEPDSVLALSERELRLAHQSGDENSGLALTLEWRAVPFEESDASQRALFWGERTNNPAWLGREKMQTLGFAAVPVSEEPRGRFERSREVFIVLEFDGPAYHGHRAQLRERAEREMALIELDQQNREFIQRAERAREYLEKEGERSRLFAVDAALSAQELRAAYPDRSRYAIVRGEIQPVHYLQDAKGPHGYIRRVQAGSIHVPFAHRAVFEQASSSAYARTPAFVAELAFGKRLEPWLRQVEPAAGP